VVVSADCAQHPLVARGLAVLAAGSTVPGGLCQPAEPQLPGVGLAVVVAVHKGHLMTARGGIAECLRAACPASRDPERKQT